MSHSGVDALDRSVEKTRAWIQDLQREIPTRTPERAWSALRAVLHALRNRLTAAEVLQLSAQLPLVVRGLLFEGWTLHASPSAERSREDFLAKVAEPLLAIPDLEPEATTRAVFRVLSRRISEGEIGDLRGILPAPIQELWPPVREQVDPVAGAAEALAGPPASRRGASRSKIRKAKNRIRGALARARAEGIPARDLPLMVTRGKLRPKRQRRPKER